MYVAQEWKDYEVVDTGGGEKLERWGDIVLRRPDPQIIWSLSQETAEWRDVHGHYHRSSSGGGSWDMKKPTPERWTISYGPLKFHIKPTSFKHTGLFPEQAANWSWMMDKIKGAGRPISVLNLFAYTGGATTAAAYAGASVVHVDAAKGMVQWAKENVQLSGLVTTVRYASLRTMCSNSCNVNNAGETDMMRSLWTLLPTGADQTVKRGSWKKACIRFWNPA